MYRRRDFYRLFDDHPKLGITFFVVMLLLNIIVHINDITDFLFKQEITYITINETIYHEPHFCNEQTNAISANTFNEYLLFDTSSNLQKDEFENYIIIQVNNIITTKNSIIKTESILTVDDTLYIIFSETKNTNNPSCGELLIRLPKDTNFKEIKTEYTTPHVFIEEETNDIYTYLENKDSDGQDYFAFTSSYTHKITKVETKYENNHLLIRDISFIRHNTAYYYYLEETPYIKINDSLINEEKSD